MPRLNLDIFGDSTQNGSDEVVPAVTVDSRTHRSGDSVITRSLPRSHDQTPRFIPVGFYERHLHLLDEAVLRLRRQGFWKASKSGIIRGLIERHSDELAIPAVEEHHQAPSQEVKSDHTPKS